MIGLAGIVTLTAVGARFVWLWLIVAGAVAVFYMIRKLRAMRQAKAEAAAAHEAEVERILNTKIPGLDDEDDELLRRYSQEKWDTPIPLRKGERRVVASGDVEVRLIAAAPGGEIDCYVFMLDGRSKTRRDEDLIFFGQPRSRDGAVTVVDGAAGIGADVQLRRVPADTERIEVAFGLGEDVSPNATWTGGTVTVRTGGDVYAYPIDADGKTRTVDALRLYRHGGEWKLWLEDHRSIQGISKLCEEYGIDVA